MKALIVFLLTVQICSGAVIGFGNAGNKRVKSNLTPPSAPSGPPAFSEVQLSAGSSSASSQTINITVASGAMISVGAKWEELNRTVTVTDTASNVYTPLGKTNAGPDHIWVQQFYAQNVTGGALTITVNYGATTDFVRAAAVEVSGCSPTAALDQTAVPGSDVMGPGDPVPTVSGDVTTTAANEILIAFGANYGGFQSGVQTDWTKLIDVTAFDAQYRVVSSISTYHGEHNALTSGGNEIVVMSTFK